MQNKRPGILTAVCIVGFLGTLGAIPLLFSGSTATLGTWYQPVFILGTIVSLVSFIGLWMMKKWGIITYTVAYAVSEMVTVAVGMGNIFQLIVPGIIIAIGFSKYKLME